MEGSGPVKKNGFFKTHLPRIAEKAKTATTKVKEKYNKVCKKHKKTGKSLRSLARFAAAMKLLWQTSDAKKVLWDDPKKVSKVFQEQGTSVVKSIGKTVTKDSITKERKFKVSLTGAKMKKWARNGAIGTALLGKQSKAKKRGKYGGLVGRVKYDKDGVERSKRMKVGAAADLSGRALIGGTLGLTKALAWNFALKTVLYKGVWKFACVKGIGGGSKKAIQKLSKKFDRVQAVAVEEGMAPSGATEGSSLDLP